MIKTFRVYRYYVGCYVYDVDAKSARAASEKVETFGHSPSDGVQWLHEANEPSENHFFTEVFEYGSDGEIPDEPAFAFNPACAKMWRELPPHQDEEGRS